ncbi:MAG: OmpA family protein [Saprospiraceae bacterium]|nr:OmpA family protein [Saprospiraceae bacterium]
MNNIKWATVWLSIFFTSCLFNVIAQVPEFPITKSKIEIQNATAINTADLEFSPVYYQNGIVYVSSQTQKVNVDKKIGEHFFTLMYAELDPNGLPISPQPFSATVSSQVHEGPVSFGSNQEVIYFTRNTKDLSRLKIFDAEKGDADWENVEPLPFCSDDYSVCHPSINSANNKLYFASNMPGGEGGMDIYVVELDSKGKWGEPRNLGPGINSNKNESFPFIHKSGLLFFASDKRGGYGGVDIYVADTNEKLLEAKNIREPFNSEADDLGFILNDDASGGFFTSARAGGAGKDDIYYFKIDESNTSANANIVVVDKKTQAPIANAEVRIFERSADGFISGDDLYEVVMVPSNNSNGEVNIKLVRKVDTQLGTPNAYTDQQGLSKVKMRSEKQYLLLVTKTGYQSDEQVITTISKSAPFSFKVELDNQACTNLTGYVKDSNSKAGLKDAVVVIKNKATGKETNISTDSKGMFQACLPINNDYEVSFNKAGYTQTTSTFYNDNAIDFSKNFEMSTSNTTTLQAGSIIVIENIYYDFNQSEIRKGAARELDALAELMKNYPDMEILMTSHTDSRGTASYNQKLSEKRAIAAKNYIVAKGIASSRITTAGAGESTPRNNCTDNVECTETEHQYNRRTDVKITKINSDLKVEYKPVEPEVIDNKKKN